MPRRQTEKKSKNRYSSVTMPRDFCFFLDRLILLAGEKESQTPTGNLIPSRRAIVQDAVEFYIEQIFPDLHKDYVEMLKDCGMYQRLAVHNLWKGEHR